MELAKLIGIGVVLGISTAIPGVSAGTLAVVFNIYDRLVSVVTLNVKKIAAAWKFLLPLIIGGVAGIFLFSRLVTMLFETHPVQTFWFFSGIIAGSLPMVYRRACRSGSPFPSLPSAICAIVAFLLMVLMVLARPSPQALPHTALTPEVLGTLAAGGALAGLAMIIPGTSGSFVLLVIGLYRTAVQAVADLNIPLIVPLAAGAVFGLFAGAALVRYLLAKAPRVTYGTVLGLVAGSLIVLFPGGLGSGIGAAVSLAVAFAGFFVSYAAGRGRDAAV